ncbi:unnamed protein product [Eruca vesicaria subsp. sativa]|uniref:Uncharacterized protein n=1 Tax=Eruca vesicaria subsp. sativa TaxID=29727 RepID=A0ABC8KKD5_ERUVS|nr:unnamed protein product [Eruca vesicaria subsp. sativa]
MNIMFYFLLALTAVLPITAYPGDPVLDINGDAILGGSYYILPAISGTGGGGLSFVSLPNMQCPIFIGQETSEVNRGIPVKFSNWKSRVGFVPEAESLNIQMDVAATTCGQSTYWWVSSTYLRVFTCYIKAGPKPVPGEDSSMSFFKIKKIGEFRNGYKITYCFEGYGCHDVGIARDGYGVRRLVLGDYMSYPVVFMKATETETSSKTMSII